MRFRAAAAEGEFQHSERDPRSVCGGTNGIADRVMQPPQIRIPGRSADSRNQSRGAMKVVAVMSLLACVLAGCSALPTAGPTASDLKKQEVKDNQTQFDLVDINDNVVAALLASPGESFHVRFKKYGKP